MDKTIEEQLMDLVRENNKSIKSLEKRFDNFEKQLNELVVIVKRFCEVD